MHMHTYTHFPLSASLQLLAPALSYMEDIMEDITKAKVIPTIHLLASTVNTYLTRNHISWPAFENFMMGISFLKKGSYKDAQVSFDCAVSEYNDMLGPNNLMSVEAQLYLAMCVQRNDTKEAIKIASGTLARMEEVFLCNHPLSTKLSQLLATFHLEIGEKEKAQVHIKAALQKIDQCIGKAHPWSAELYYQLARIHADSDGVNSQEISFETLGNIVCHEWLNKETMESKNLGVELSVQGCLESWRVQID